MPTCRCSARSSTCISWRSFRSRAPRGSSSRSTRGRFTSARARATRWRWPPESWAGRRSPRDGQPHEVEDLPHAFRPLPRGHLPDPESVGHVLGHAHVREEGVVLEDRVDVARVGRHPHHAAAEELDLARVGLVEPGHQAQAGGLAGARRPEQGEELALAVSPGSPRRGRAPRRSGARPRAALCAEGGHVIRVRLSRLIRCPAAEDGRRETGSGSFTREVTRPRE